VGLVGAERDGEIVLGFEGVERFDRIGGNAKDIGAGAAEFALQPCEIDRLLGAAGRVGPRVEI